jgi:hypothetical protein
MWRLQAVKGDPKFSDLSLSRDYTQQMRQRGELRLSRRERLMKFLMN